MLTEQLMMLLGVTEQAAFMLMMLFWLTHSRLFQNIIKNPKRKPIENLIISVLFISFGVFSTYTGLNIEGAILNARIIAVLAGGILFGPWVGISNGLISGLHRYLIDVGGPTSLACLITSVSAGIFASWIHFKYQPNQYAKLGIIAAVLSEGFTMVLIVLLADDTQQAIEIVTLIGLPMITCSVCVGLIIKLVVDLDEERSNVAATQAKLALDIANKTLPHFRSRAPDSLNSVCNIIQQETHADAVAITDTSSLIASVGIHQHNRVGSSLAISSMTKKAVETGQLIVNNNLENHGFKSLILIPLWENGIVTGTLKIFYHQPNKIHPALKEMAIGLSQLMSTQMEVSKIEELRAMTKKAEFSALQSKINPHFLFNALNAISSLIRIDPSKARLLIINLANFLRYNLEQDVNFIDIQDELAQVKNYVAIEKARFANKLAVEFDIDEVNCKIPYLLIQPLVENAILHGIQPSSTGGKVTVSVKKQHQGYHVRIKDTGVGMKQSVIDRLYAGSLDAHSIGLNNVHQRLILLYGNGLHIESSEQGTDISFNIA
ncbi:MAG: two-component system LytT family sensor kinase [Moritella dasanensis]|jgi:two-component system LytT family sensor kinase